MKQKETRQTKAAHIELQAKRNTSPVSC